MEQVYSVQVALQKQYERPLFHLYLFFPTAEGQREFPQSALIQRQPVLANRRKNWSSDVCGGGVMFTFPCLISRQPLYHMWVLQEPACVQIHNHRHMLEQAAAHDIFHTGTHA